MRAPERQGTVDFRMEDFRQYPPIEAYGAIGDLRTVALVGPRASVDFLCFPQFDSPSIFAAHVDRDRGGAFRLEPLLRDANEKKLYLPDTNILLSRFLSEDGIAEVSDFMLVERPRRCQALVRRAKAVKGSVRFRLRCAPRFDYGRVDHRARCDAGRVEFFPETGPNPPMRLRANVDLKLCERDAVAEFELRCGQTATFILEEADGHTRGDPPDFSSHAFKVTADFWRGWISRCRYRGRWREMVHRSALALKLLTSRDFGSIVAAPCFGFPNEPGGERNWDYRYTWLRDASFTIYAFIRLGYTDEARAFTHWLERRIHELDDGGALEVMYKVDGSRLDGETLLEHFEGYKQSDPVRIGSSNHGQLQLDIYGELMDSIYLYDKHGSPLSYDLWRGLEQLIEFVCEHWNQPDAGIWEVRSGNRCFLYSRVMCWVALDRAVRLAGKRSLPSPAARWRRVRDEIYLSIYRDFWDEEKGSFVQFRGARALDASALIMPLVKFISPTDPRWLSTLDAIQRELVEDSLVYRYRIGDAFSDELAGQEGTFSICSFWLIEALSRAGELQRARYLFEKMLSYASPLGLFSEQLGARGEALGNIPQAFTHIALISAAFDLDRRLDRARDPAVGGGWG